jgi:hypothetical protein
MTDDLENLGLNLVRGFHEQFAQNQNHHQALFLQALTVLLTVLIGFGYIYVRVNAPAAGYKALIPPTEAKLYSTISVDSKDLNQGRPKPVIKSDESQAPSKNQEIRVTVETLYAFLALATLLLTLGAALICNMALGFRRDQMVAANIRILAGVMKQKDNPQEEIRLGATDFFPVEFNPTRKTGLFEWMPEFHKIFLLALVLVQVLLIYCVFASPNFDLPTKRASLDFVEEMKVAIYIIFISNFIIFLHYWWKWVQTAVRGMPRLQLKNDAIRDFLLGRTSEYLSCKFHE